LAILVALQLCIVESIGIHKYHFLKSDDDIKDEIKA